MTRINYFLTSNNSQYCQNYQQKIRWNTLNSYNILKQNVSIHLSTLYMTHLYSQYSSEVDCLYLKKWNVTFIIQHGWIFRKTKWNTNCVGIEREHFMSKLLTIKCLLCYIFVYNSHCHTEECEYLYRLCWWLYVEIQCYKSWLTQDTDKIV